MGIAHHRSRYRAVRQSRGKFGAPHPSASRAAQPRLLATRAHRAARRLAIMPSSTTSAFELPAWAQVSRGRGKHIMRVTALLAEWAEAMGLDAAERQCWIDAGRFHDALRDAPVEELR